MFFKCFAYRLFHLQKTRYLALKVLGQQWFIARWKASVCTSSRQNTSEQLWRQPSVMSERTSIFWHLPSMCCAHPVQKGHHSCIEWHQNLPFMQCEGKCQETAELKTLYPQKVLLHPPSLTWGTLCSPLWSLGDQTNDKKRPLLSNTGRAISYYLSESSEW